MFHLKLCSCFTPYPEITGLVDIVLIEGASLGARGQKRVDTLNFFPNPMIAQVPQFHGTEEIVKLCIFVNKKKKTQQTNKETNSVFKERKKMPS